MKVVVLPHVRQATGNDL